jgi:alginate O-acetyltransferase complex protein AlgJ
MALHEQHAPPAPESAKVVEGKDGWLFLDNDRNQVMRQHTGELRFSPVELREWRRVLEARIASLADRGTRHHFLVPPDAHSVYSDKLPDSIRPQRERPVLQLIRHLEQRSPARILYPLDALRRHKDRHVYAKTETHWTELGAFVAYLELIKELTRDFDVRVLREEELLLIDHASSGDLGWRVDPPRESTQTYVTVREPRARLVADNRIYNNGRRIEFECSAAPPLRCLVFGDSFAVYVLPLLCESFERLVFAHIPTLDRALVERERPDVVVYVLNERFLITIPFDDGARSLADWEAEKRARGLVYPPSPFGEDGTRVDSSPPPEGWPELYGVDGSCSPFDVR